MQHKILALAVLAFVLGVLAGQYVHFDHQPYGVSVGTDRAYCSLDWHAHPFTCERAS